MSAVSPEEAEEAADMFQEQGQHRLAGYVRDLAAERDALQAIHAGDEKRIANQRNQIAGLTETGKKLRSECAGLNRQVVAVEAEGDALAAQVAVLREALGFYADVSDYVGPLTGGMGKLWNDCGETARAALQVDANNPAPSDVL